MANPITRTLSLTAATGVISVSLVVLLAWWFGPESPLDLFDALPTMAIGTAFCFLLLSVNLLWLQRYRWSSLLSLLVLGVTLLALLDDSLLISLGGELQLARDSILGQPAERMSIITAISLCLAAILLHGLSGWQKKCPAVYDALFVLYFCIAFATLLSYLLKPAALFEGSVFYPFSIPTLFCFFLLAIPMVFEIRSQQSVLVLFTLQSNGARRFRMLTMFIVLIPFVVGMGFLLLVSLGVIGEAFALALFLTISLLVIVSSLAYSACREDHFYYKLNKVKQCNLSLQQKLSSVIDVSNEALLLFSATGDIIHCNRGVSQLLGWGREELLNMHFNDLVPERLRDEHRRFIAEFICSDKVTVDSNNPVRMQVLHKDGHEHPILTTITKRHVGDELLIALSAKNAEQIQQQLSELGAKAYYDALTGLLNRHALNEWAKSYHPKGQRLNDLYGIMMVDIDHFKRINDLWGHSVGDQVLVAVARCMEKCLRDSDRVYRVGGEEFLVLASSVDLEAVERFSNRICQEVRKLPILHDGGEIWITCSVGFTQVCKQDAAVFEAMRRADQALYMAKEQGRDRVVGR